MDTIWHRLVRGVWRVRQRPDWADFAGPGWLDRIMQVAVTDRFHAKQGRSIGRWALTEGGRRLVVYLKRHYRLPWLSGLLALLLPGRWSPAGQEWDHLAWAAANGLPVPSAAACGEFIGPWGRLQSFIAVEELTDMLALHEAIPLAAARLRPADFSLWKRRLATEVARIVRAFHDRNRFHKDLYLCHFYIAEADTYRLAEWAGRVRIIDLHRLGHHPLTRAWWRAKDLGQLLYSSDVIGVTARDRLRFWQIYHAIEPARRPWRLLRWVVGLRARRYQELHETRSPTPKASPTRQHARSA
ncbi:MAG TPA: lipopolysaccharide kinase InaA family protein [Gemmataceae bacterium]|nr:lipopolysaccharide kinase InaA family protein [Gemmataceae bacterium]